MQQSYGFFFSWLFAAPWASQVQNQLICMDDFTFEKWWAIILDWKLTWLRLMRVIFSILFFSSKSILKISWKITEKVSSTLRARFSMYEFSKCLQNYRMSLSLFVLSCSKMAICILIESFVEVQPHEEERFWLEIISYWWATIWSWWWIASNLGFLWFVGGCCCCNDKMGSAS